MKQICIEGELFYQTCGVYLKRKKQRKERALKESPGPRAPREVPPLTDSLLTHGQSSASQSDVLDMSTSHG